jgi:hypothetical protein
MNGSPYRVVLGIGSEPFCASKAERTIRARAAAYALHSQRDSREVTANARSAAWLKYLERVDPEGELPEPERVRRAEALRRSVLLRASLKSAKARRTNKAQRGIESLS